MVATRSIATPSRSIVRIRILRSSQDQQLPVETLPASVPTNTWLQPRIAAIVENALTNYRGIVSQVVTTSDNGLLVYVFHKRHRIAKFPKTYFTKATALAAQNIQGRIQRWLDEAQLPWFKSDVLYKNKKRVST